MKQHTNEAIKAEIIHIYDVMEASYTCTSKMEIEIPVNTPTSVRIKISSMYEAPPMNTRLIFPLCEFFETKHINDVNRWEESGCETCDWGSNYGFELEVLP